MGTKPTDASRTTTTTTTITSTMMKMRSSTMAVAALAVLAALLLSSSVRAQSMPDISSLFADLNVGSSGGGSSPKSAQDCRAGFASLGPILREAHRRRGDQLLRNPDHEERKVLCPGLRVRVRFIQNKGRVFFFCSCGKM